MTRIEIRGLRFRYPGRGEEVLKGVTTVFSESRVTALLGPNASGKTTLFKVLLKVLSPTAGSIHVNGKEIGRLSLAELSKTVAWVPQEEEPLFPYTVHEYLMLGRAPHLGFFDVPTRADERIIRQTLAELGISGLGQRETTDLSGGEKRLIFIARALVQQTEVLILDEPTVHLDLRNKARVLRAIRKAARAGKTVIFSTHDVNEASLVADEVKILNGGRIITQGDPAKVLTEKVLKGIYGTKLVFRRVDRRPIAELSPENFGVRR
ncbi:MAG: ABC transporter ATP-binding protein [Candidatus Hadarchaeum sp.]|uniref:ABC transporter ATP-binding protein n=1 Tax=Candidatus Hadarchaeum sp. TaxID=2883567 RepID=UPI003D0D5B0D